MKTRLFIWQQFRVHISYTQLKPMEWALYVVVEKSQNFHPQWIAQI